MNWKDCVDSTTEIKILGFQWVGYKIDFYVLDLKGDRIYTMNLIAQISVPFFPCLEICAV
ncbi:hypothetical protein RhiirA4_404259 [Rhizophagus irregularis]|uniref:Uncharacterized protein n=1 Tax=Rhizophagus irregularis TaxID=588596 RepID=A0A2I1GP11_9GLOM|nr:hypothetical protein RhiirA4_404259 [Rhizophagus irregularis]